MSNLPKAVANTATNIKLGFGRQVGYGLGEFAGQFFYSFWSSYLSVYYTDVVGIGPAIVGVIFMIARVWDAINDPLMGNIADRHVSKKWGRYRPWILFGAPILVVLSILMFHVPNLDADGAKIAYATITYILAGMAFTATNIPYMSMQSTLTTNIQSRIDLSSMKSAFTCVGTLVLNLIAMPVILYFSQGEQANQRGFFFGTIIFSIFGLILYMITFASTKEVYYPEMSSVKVSFKDTLKFVFGSKLLVIMMIALLLSYLCMFGRLGVAVYYYIYCLNKPMMVGLLMMIPPAAGIVPQYLVPKLKVSKKLLVIVAFAVRAITLIGIFFTGFENNKVIIVLLVIHGIFCFDMGILWGLTAPCIDDAEVRTGKRLDGTVYAFLNLFLKIASAVGASIGLAIMAAMGYVANQGQTPQAMTGINIATNLLPAIFIALAIIPFLFFNLNQKKIEGNRAILEERHANSENMMQQAMGEAAE